MGSIANVRKGVSSSMKLVFASDSFKGSLSALRIAQLLREEAAACFPEAETACVPVADGGEGTVEALLTAKGGELQTVEVTGPDGRPVAACYGRMPDGSAVIEMAQASGLPHMAVLDPLHATSRGTGELMLHALRHGARRLLIGLGGSATNDGGMGMLAALGARFLNSAGMDVPEGGGGLAAIEHADFSGLVPELSQAELTVICDVTNPLLGAQGATAVYGPQKGVTPKLLPQLESGMAKYAAAIEKATGLDIRSIPGGGAAGGMGAALGGVLGAQLCRGIDAVLDFVDFDSVLQDADLVITGEGCMDGQSIAFGKVVAGIAQRCEARKIPVCAIVGSMRPGAEDFLELSEQYSIMTTVNAVMPLETAMTTAESLYRSAARRMFRLLRMGLQMRMKASEASVSC